jgi:hypothetical protein
MAISDDRRHALHNRLDEALGPDEAATLMELLPPPWADLATTRDVDAGVSRLDASIGRLDDKVDGLARRLDRVEAIVEENRAQLGNVRVEMRDLRVELSDLRAKFSDRLAESSFRLTQHTRTLSIAMIGQSGVVAAGIFGAAALFG